MSECPPRASGVGRGGPAGHVVAGVGSSEAKKKREKEKIHTDSVLYCTPDILSGGPPSWGLEHRGLCFGCDLFINLQPHDLGRRISGRNFSGVAAMQIVTTPGFLALVLPQGLNGSFRCSGMR